MARCASWRAPSSGVALRKPTRDGSRLRTCTQSGFTTEIGCTAGVGWRRGGANGQPAPAAGRAARPRGRLGAAPGAAAGRAVAAARPAGRPTCAGSTTRSHFWLVFVVAAVNVVLGVRMSGPPAGTTTPGCSWSRWPSWPAPASSLLHALATPGHAGRTTPTSGSTLAQPVGLALAALFAVAVGAADLDGAGGRAVLVLRASPLQAGLLPRCIVVWGVGVAARPAAAEPARPGRAGGRGPLLSRRRDGRPLYVVAAVALLPAAPPPPAGDAASASSPRSRCWPRRWSR